MKKSLCVLMALGFVSTGAFADTRLDTVDIISYDDSISEKSPNVLVLNKEDIEKRGFKSVREALSNMPGVYVEANAFDKAVDMRGFGSHANRRVKVMVDGVNINSVETNHASADIDRVDIADVEYIEVVPGGGNIAYGSNASAGVINIITKSGSSKPYTSAYIKKGSFEHNSFGFGQGLPLSKKVYVSASFNSSTQEGYQYADVLEVANARFGLNIAPTDTQSLAINVAVDNKKSRSSATLSKEERNKNRRQGGMNCRGGVCTPAHDGYISSKEKIDLSLKYQNQINENILVKFMPYHTDSRGGFEYTRIGGKLELGIKYGISNTTLGYEIEEGKQNYSYVDRVSLADSIYILENLKFNDMFGVDIGGRYKNDKIDLKIKQGMKRGSPDYVSMEHTKRTEDAFGANIILNANINENHKVYAKVENGFETPDMYQLFDKKPHPDKTDAPFYYKNKLKKETYMTYEVGYKGMFGEQYVGLNVFYTDTKDEIYVTGYAHSNNMNWYNIPKTQRYGAELSLEQSFFGDSLAFSEGFTYINAVSKSDSGFDNTGVKNGEKIPGVSPFKMNLNARYNPIKELGFRANYSYFSKTKWQLEKELDPRKPVENDKKAYGVLDVGVTYEPTKNMSLSFDVKNVLGEKYEAYCDGNGGCNPAAEQVYLAEFRYKY